jgi:HK97 gp10 family phage protein
MARMPVASLGFRATINFSLIQDSIEFAIVAAVNQTVDQAYAHAQQKVPVRKVFKGGSRRFKTLPRLGQAEIDKGIVVGTPQWERFQQIKAAREITDLPKGTAHYLPSNRTQTNRPWANRYFPLPGSLSRQSRTGLTTGPVPKGRKQLAQALDLRRRVVEGNADAIAFLDARGRYELKRVGTTKNPSAIFPGDLGDRQVMRLGGRLKGEMDTERASYGTGPRFEGAVTSKTPYAKYVEFGTRYAAAQPYLRPALDSVRNRFRENIIRTVKKAGRFGSPVGVSGYAPRTSGEAEHALVHSLGGLGDDSLVRDFFRAHGIGGG